MLEAELVAGSLSSENVTLCASASTAVTLANEYRSNARAELVSLLPANSKAAMLNNSTWLPYACGIAGLQSLLPFSGQVSQHSLRVQPQPTMHAFLTGVHWVRWTCWSVLFPTCTPEALAVCWGAAQKQAVDVCSPWPRTEATQHDCQPYAVQVGFDDPNDLQ